MLDWLTNRGEKPDHPMHNIEEAQQLLYGLPDDPQQALEEITSWLTTITSAGGFRLATRIAVVKLVDEHGQPFNPLVTQKYLDPQALKEFERLRLWQHMLEFQQRLADAYRLCLDEMQRDAKLMRAHRSDLPLLIARALRAIAGQCKVRSLRYIPVAEELWRQLFDLYRLSEAERCDTQRVAAYESEPLPTTPQTELLRALLLAIARPESMLPHQTEIAARIIARYADAVLLKTAPEVGCTWQVDLAQPRAPEFLRSGAAAAPPTCRYFGASTALVKIHEAIRRLSAGPAVKEQRFGAEYSAAEKLAVLKRLTQFWGEQSPQPREPRQASKGEILLVHGYAAACVMVPRAQFSGWSQMIITMDDALKAKLGITTEPVKIPQEQWPQRDVSARGLAAEIPRGSEPKIRIGTLVALQAGGQRCTVGIVRRLFRDAAQRLHAGIELLGKNPVTMILRRIGQSGVGADKFTMASDASSHDYLNAILLGEGTSSNGRCEILLTRRAFIAGFIYEAMIGNGKPHLQVDELIEQGTDFDRARCTWMTSRASP